MSRDNSSPASRSRAFPGEIKIARDEYRYATPLPDLHRRRDLVGRGDSALRDARKADVDGVPRYLACRQLRADVERRLQDRPGEALEEMGVDLAPDTGPAERIGGRGIEVDDDAVRMHQSLPLDENPVLPQ